MLFGADSAIAAAIASSAMARTVFDTTSRLNTLTIAADAAATFSAVPAEAFTRFELRVTNSNATTGHKLTFPPSFSEMQCSGATATWIPRGAQLLLEWIPLHHALQQYPLLRHEC